MKTAEKKPQLKQVIMWAGLFVTIASAALIVLELTKPADHAGLMMHSHARLTYYVDGDRIPLPAGIGINEELWKGHDLDEYGANNSAPLHTHSMDGVIHIESTMLRPYTVGNLLHIWGLDTEGKIVSVCKEFVQMSLGERKEGCDPLDQNYILKDGDTLRLSLDSWQ
jgi:hypothetical protein